MSTQTVVSSSAIAEEFRAAVQGKLADDKIAAAVASIEAATGRYPATGKIINRIFYLEFQINVTGGKTFTGQAGGRTSPGGESFTCDLYTDDIDRLYRDTIGFVYLVTPVYFSIQFFDAQSNLLGYLYATAASIVIGTGGGSGRWS